MRVSNAFRRKVPTLVYLPVFHILASDFWELRVWGESMEHIHEKEFNLWNLNETGSYSPSQAGYTSKRNEYPTLQEKWPATVTHSVLVWEIRGYHLIIQPIFLDMHPLFSLKSHSLWLPSGRSLYRFPDLYSLCLLGGSPTSPLPTTDIVVSSASSLSPLPMTEVWWQIQQILDPSSLEDLGRVSDVACSWIFSNSVETRSTCPALLEGEAVHRAVFRTSGQFTGSLQSCTLPIWDFSSKLPCVYVALCDLMGPLLTALY